MFALGLGLGFFAGRRAAIPGADVVSPRRIAHPLSADADASTPTQVSSTNAVANPSVVRLADLPIEFARLWRLPSESRRTGFQALAKRLSPSDFPGALKLANRSLAPVDSYPFVEALLNHWIQSDLAGALAHAHSPQNRRERSNALSELYAAWAALDPSAALAAAHSEAPANNRWAQVRAVLNTLSLAHPERAIQEIRALKNQALDDLLPVAISHLAQQDPAAAMREMSTLGVDQRLRITADVFQEWVRVDPDAAVAWCEGLPPGLERRVSFTQLCSSIAVVDPARAVAIAQTSLAYDPERQILHQAFSTWCSRDLNAAEKWLAGNSQEYPKLRQDWLRAAVEFDPAIAARYLDKNVSLEERSTFAKELTWQWAQTDPAAAQAWVSQLPPGAGRENAWAQLYSGQAEVDPVGTLATVMALPADARKGAVGGVFQAWERRDSDAATAWLIAQPPEIIGMTLSDRILNRLATQDPVAAGRIFLALPDPDQQLGLVDNLLGRWGVADLPGAVTFAQALPEGSIKEKALGTVGNMLAVTDPKAAITFSQELPDSPARNQFIVRAVESIGQDQVQATAQWLQELPPGNARDQALQAAADVWIRQNPQKALAWIEGLPASPLRRGKLADAVGTWANSDPSAAAAYATSLSDPDDQFQAVQNVVQGMAANDPKKAAEWLAQFPDGQLKRTSTPSVAQIWAAKDPQAAMNWISTLPADGTRFQALQPVMDEAGQRIPQAAWTWATALTDPRERDEAMVRVGRRWIQSNPSGARSAVEAADPSPEVRKLIGVPKP